MDEATLRRYVEAHVTALLNGDVESITQDFAEPLRPQLPGILASLPVSLPLASAEIVSIEAGEDVGVVRNRLAGADGSGFTMRSEWQVTDGRPRIIAGAPV